MKILKKILIVVVIIVAIPLIAALFLKKDFSAERSIVIAKPRMEVFNYLRYLKNQDNFSKWASMDPDMKKSYTGTDGTVGFISAWESDKDDVGHGEQEIMKITEGERIDYELRFKKPFESTSPAALSTEDAEGGTKVTWWMSGSMPYPMNLMLLFMDMEEAIGNDFDTGLANLKGILEKGA